MNFTRVITLIGLSCTLAISAVQAKSPYWQLNGNQWNNYYEQKYSEFIQTLGEARAKGYCYTTDACLKSAVANPMYVNQNPSSLRVRSDCADLPFVLRAYFSWVNDLPFSYPSWPSLAPTEKVFQLQQAYAQLKANKPDGFWKKNKWKRDLNKIKKEIEQEMKRSGSRDIRYSRSGNIITKRIVVTAGQHITRVINDINEKVSTASFRIRADRYDTGRNYQDFYPVAINRKAIIPGTVLYDPSGHIAVVYKVTDDGRILLIDAHPDQSLTHITYGKKFSRSGIKINGGFKNWRRITYRNGVIIPTPNSAYPNYSLEQFIGNMANDITIPFRRAHYYIAGQELDYYDYVRTKMFKGVLSYNPLQEISNRVEELCEDFKARVSSVQSAIRNGIATKSHPSRLPSNIYGTSGEWETYSTPSRDARFKTLFVETFDDARRFVEMSENGDPLLNYSGYDLRSELQNLYYQNANACTATITLSSGQPATLSLYQVGKSLFDLSFDPYHCIELRWGLVDLAEQTAACQSRKQFSWYNAERTLRNQIQRNYGLNTAFSYRELMNAQIGRETPYTVDFDLL